jgi:hypothetical protein
LGQRNVWARRPSYALISLSKKMLDVADGLEGLNYIPVDIKKSKDFYYINARHRRRLALTMA